MVEPCRRSLLRLWRLPVGESQHPDLLLEPSQDGASFGQLASIFCPASGYILFEMRGWVEVQSETSHRCLCRHEELQWANHGKNLDPSDGAARKV